MLTKMGRIAAVMIIASGALLTNASDATASSVRACTAEEAAGFCSSASGGGYQSGPQEWMCASSAQCLYDDEHNEYAGYIMYTSQNTPCEGGGSLPCS